MTENENFVESDIRDIAHEFNVIVDSVKDDKSNFVHDRYFRFAFAKPSRMVELLTLFSRHNPSLKAFLDTIDLASLRGSSENLSSDKHAGSADLVFEANLKDGGVTGLYVGIIAEHKSTNRDNVFLQISEYYHHLFLERGKDVPVVAFIVYNGEDGWDPLSETRFPNYPEYYHDIGFPFKVEFLDVGHAIDDAELKSLSPITLVALTAMKYICAKRNIPRLGHIGKYTCRCDSRLSIFGKWRSSPCPFVRRRSICSRCRIPMRGRILSNSRFRISFGSGPTRAR